MFVPLPHSSVEALNPSVNVLVDGAFVEVITVK